jgi:hypothetical protein
LFAAMRRALVIAGVMLAGLLAMVPSLAAAPGPALAAAPKSAHVSESSFEHVSLHKHIGDDIVYLQAGEEDEGVTFSVTRGPYSVTYRTDDGGLEGKTITARFGRLGHLHLVLDGAVPQTGACGRRSYTDRAFKGEFEFHGEGGYLDFDLHSISGEVQATSACPPGTRSRPADEADSEPSAVLVAKTTVRPARVLVAIGEHTSDGRLAGEVFAALAERREGMTIQRTTAAALRGSQFSWDLARGTATVRPGTPFTGRATFHRHPRAGAPRLTGNLRVPTLGGPELFLTGKRFNAKITKELPPDEKRVLGTGEGIRGG